MNVYTKWKYEATWLFFLHYSLIMFSEPSTLAFSLINVIQIFMKYLGLEKTFVKYVSF